MPENAFAQHVTTVDVRLATKHIVSMAQEIFSYFCASFNHLLIICYRRFLTLIIINNYCSPLRSCSEWRITTEQLRNLLAISLVKVGSIVRYAT